MVWSGIHQRRYSQRSEILTLAVPPLPAECADKGRNEILDSLRARDERIEQGKNPSPPVTEDHAESSHLSDLTMCALRVTQPVICESLSSQ
jgi:hypothetical protein